MIEPIDMTGWQPEIREMYEHNLPIMRMRTLDSVLKDIEADKEDADITGWFDVSLIALCDILKSITPEEWAIFVQRANGVLEP